MKTLTTLACLALSTPVLAQAPVYEIHGIAPGDAAGHAVAGVGDVDGDGWDDVGVGMPFADPFGNSSGRVQVVSGRTGQVIRTWSGQNAGDQFGQSLAGIGDLDGDGLAEVLIGAPRYYQGGSPNVGRVYVASGAGPIIAAHSPAHPGDYFGTSVAGVGDVDGDGVGDYAGGTPYRDGAAGVDTGYFEVRSGATHALLFYQNGYNAGDRMGRSLTGVGDVDGDGRDDIVVGAPGFDTKIPWTKADTGRVYVYGYKTGFGQMLFNVSGSWAGGLQGYSVAGVGDIDGDLVGDFVVGAPGATQNGANSGEARVISGKTRAVLLTHSGPAGSNAGWAVAGLGDMDGDGIGEIGVALPGYDSGFQTNVGVARALSGANGQMLYFWKGSHNYEGDYLTLAGAGDLNRDGRADAVIGTATYKPDGTTSFGRARIVLAEAPYPKTYCTAKVNSAGCTPKITASGAASLSIADNFRVGASSILYSVPGILIWSRIQASTPFGGGVLCLSAPIIRTPGQSSGGTLGDPCSGSFDFHFSHAYMASKGLGAGSLLHAQYWSRDNGFAPPNSINLTNAVSFHVLP